MITNDWLVPILVAIIVGGIVVWQRRPSRPLRRNERRQPPPGPDAIARLAVHLGVGILIESVEAGPPARIVAAGLLDGDRTPLVGVGSTEDDAWEDLARAAIAWKRDDPRNIRTYLGA